MKTKTIETIGKMDPSLVAIINRNRLRMTSAELALSDAYIESLKIYDAMYIDPQLVYNGLALK
jgi:hypothetical protein